MTGRRLILISLAFVAAGALACAQEAEAFDDVQSLAQAVSEAGVSCDRVDEGPQAQLVAASGSCAGSGITLYLFTSEEKLEDWKKVAARIGPVVIGPNWTATGDVADLERLSDELGAELSNP